MTESQDCRGCLGQISCRCCTFWIFNVVFKMQVLLWDWWLSQHLSALNTDAKRSFQGEATLNLLHLRTWYAFSQTEASEWGRKVNWRTPNLLRLLILVEVLSCFYVCTSPKFEGLFFLKNVQVWPNSTKPDFVLIYIYKFFPQVWFWWTCMACMFIYLLYR